MKTVLVFFAGATVGFVLGWLTCALMTSGKPPEGDPPTP